MLTPELIQQRKGNITASAAHRIMAAWDAPEPSRDYPTLLHSWIVKHDKKPLVGQIREVMDIDVNGKMIDAAWKAYQFDKPSQGLLTYAEELACDELFDHDPMTDVQTRAMDFGTEREPEAVELLIEQTGMAFEKTGSDQVHVSANGIGATPDGIVYDDIDLIVTGAEIKARTPLHHARQLFINDNASLLDHDFDRYCQMQVCMHVCECQEWYSVSYNPYAIDPAHRFHYCIIKRDDAFLDVFKRRADMVFKHKAEFLERLKGVSDLRKAA